MSLSSVRRGVAAARILLPALALIIAVHVSGCGTRQAPAEIRFALASEDASLGVTPRNVQFYVHDVELIDAQGRAHAFELVDAGSWQSRQVALVDLAGAEGTARRASIQGAVAAAAETAKYSALRFTVGVPFELNHANPLAAAAPLERGELFWTWQSGYKFIRADLDVDEREWSFHLGSTGCISASAVRPPASPCAQPNRMRVELKGDALRGIVRFDLAALVDAARAAAFAICTGNYANAAACAPAYATTALRPTTGVCADTYCGGQRLWKLD